MSKRLLGGIIGCRYKTSSWHLCKSVVSVKKIYKSLIYIYESCERERSRRWYNTFWIMKISTSWSSVFSFQCSSDFVFTAYVTVYYYYHV